MVKKEGPFPGPSFLFREVSFYFICSYLILFLFEMYFFLFFKLKIKPVFYNLNKFMVKMLEYLGGDG
jgi:hypothetical protein